MTLLTSRFKTYTVGDEFEASEGNQLQDGIIANCHRVTTRTIKLPFQNLWKADVGAPTEDVNGNVRSVLATNVISLPLHGIWQESAAKIVQIRIRLFQDAADRFTVRFLRYDSGADVEVYATADTVVTGWKWFEGPITGVDVVDTERYRVTLTHGAEGTGTDTLLASHCQIVLGD